MPQPPGSIRKAIPEGICQNHGGGGLAIRRRPGKEGSYSKIRLFSMEDMQASDQNRPGNA
jgi:hypothetical protein